jgi:hypothetical protein
MHVYVDVCMYVCMHVYVRVHARLTEAVDLLAPAVMFLFQCVRACPILYVKIDLSPRIRICNAL